MATTIKEFAANLHTATNETFKKNNPQLFKTGVATTAVATSSQARTGTAGDTGGGKPNTSVCLSPEDKLNKLERRWLAVLRTRYPKPGIQNITLRLSNGVRYTPDLNSNEMPLVFFETKGLHRFREKGILKLRWAATQYPFFTFVLVTWDKETQRWTETIIPRE